MSHTSRFPASYWIIFRARASIYERTQGSYVTIWCLMNQLAGICQISQLAKLLKRGFISRLSGTQTVFTRNEEGKQRKEGRRTYLCYPLQQMVPQASKYDVSQVMGYVTPVTQWEGFISAVCIGFKHIISLVPASIAICCSSCSKPALC